MTRMTEAQFTQLKARTAGQPSLIAQRNAPKQRKTQKYGNKRVVDENGDRFDSQAEHRHWKHLLLVQKSGAITNLRRQVVYVLAPSVSIGGRTVPALRYIADMVYDEDGKTIVADVKGAVTPVYRIKRHLMATVHGIEIKEIRA